MVAQVLETATNKIFTVNDIFQRGMILQEAFTDKSSGHFHLLFNFRKQDRIKSFIWSVINSDGIIVKNYLLENSLANRENIEIQHAGSSTLKLVAGTVGETNRVGYNGFYAGFLEDGSDPSKQYH